MGRFFVSFILILSAFFIIGSFTTTSAQSPRYSSCDLCGFCPPNNAPQNWESCVKCIYPDLQGRSPDEKSTLLIDAASGLPPTPAAGFQYTGIGCLSTGAGGFSRPGAMTAVVQTILNIVFQVVGGIAFLYLLYGTYIIISSRASPEKLDYGKRLIFGAIIGLVFTLSSVFIIRIVVSGILKVPTL